MELALELAGRAKERTYPNPMVGAVIVRNGRITGKGYHRKAGGDHAEIAAIKDAAGDCRGAEMYVTLEPCDHYGRTPPCTRAIIDAGIRKVHVAITDPNPLNSGRGVRRLRRAGIKVDVGMCAEEASKLNRKYIKFITTALPHVTLKLAQSLDGRIAARDGSSKWITSDRARRHARKIRSAFGAVIVGANTVRKDDPFLLDENGKGHGICRAVLDSRLSLSLNSNLVRTADKAPLVIATTELAPKNKLDKLHGIDGVEVITFKSKGSKVPLRRFLKRLAAKGIVSVLVEGGGELAGSMIDGALVDELMFFIAPRLIGGEHVSVKSRGVRNIAGAKDLKDVSVRRFGEDVLIRGSVV